MLPAKADVLVAAAEQHLFAVLHDTPVDDARVAERLSAAPADGLDFLDGVRPCQQPLTAFKQVVPLLWYNR